MSFDPALLVDIPDLSIPVISDSAPTQRELLTSLRCMDLTTLAGDDTDRRVSDLCRRAVALADERRVAAVCIFPVFIELAKRELEGSGISVATVAAAFPHGLSPLGTRISEVEAARDLGADEIDIVIRRSHVLEGDFLALFHEVSAFKSTCGPAHLKAILATGELGSPEAIYRAALTCAMAGADFVKTSTGKEAINATPEAASAMLASTRKWREVTGHTVGFKAAGGVRNAQQAAVYQRIASQTMGPEYVAPATFRLGASGLLDDVLAALA
jgi:deoxyribose-phosphate aldolase